MTKISRIARRDSETPAACRSLVFFSFRDSSLEAILRSAAGVAGNLKESGLFFVISVVCWVGLYGWEE